MTPRDEALDSIIHCLHELNDTTTAARKPLLDIVCELHQQNEINRAILNAHNEQKKALFAHLKSHHLT